VTFNSDGPKTACAAIIDDAGNASLVQKANITIDTIEPTPPTLSPNNLSGVNASCVNVTPSNVTEPNLWKFEYRKLGEDWKESLTSLGDVITIGLIQDFDNVIEVRAVDDAGNRSSAAQIAVEENSSLFLPTNLKIKQICDGGNYAILKDMSVKRPVYRPASGNPI